MIILGNIKIIFYSKKMKVFNFLLVFFLSDLFYSQTMHLKKKLFYDSIQKRNINSEALSIQSANSGSVNPVCEGQAINNESINSQALYYTIAATEATLKSYKNSEALFINSLIDSTVYNSERKSSKITTSDNHISTTTNSNISTTLATYITSSTNSIIKTKSSKPTASSVTTTYSKATSSASTFFTTPLSTTSFIKIKSNNPTTSSTTMFSITPDSSTPFFFTNNPSLTLSLTESFTISSSLNTRTYSTSNSFFRKYSTMKSKVKAAKTKTKIKQIKSFEKEGIIKSSVSIKTTTPCSAQKIISTNSTILFFFVLFIVIWFDD